MPARNTPLVTDHFYHVYNRGVAKLPIFHNKRDYERFLLTVEYYHLDSPGLKLSHLLLMQRQDRIKRLSEHLQNSTPLVDIICYTLMPNHIHLLLKQRKDAGISKFCRLLFNSYNKYFNRKHDRVGPLFQGNFKAVRITNQEELLHVSRYIHLNPITAFIIHKEDLEDFPWSSYQDYLHEIRSFLSTEIILSSFRSIDAYKEFTEDQVDYAKKLSELKYAIIEKYPDE